jgi:hypothetical protein
MFHTPKWDYDASSESLYSQVPEPVSLHTLINIIYLCHVFTLNVRLGVVLSAITNSTLFKLVLCYCSNNKYMEQEYFRYWKWPLS